MKNESYPIHQSALFKIRNKKRLADLLGVTFAEIKSFLSDGNYHEFPLQPNKLIDHPKFQRKPRPIQDPKGKLKTIQKRILHLLNRISVPDYLYSAIKGRSYIDNAMQHKDSAVTFCIDIKDFYGNIGLKQVRSFFLDTLKCSPDIAFILSSLVSYRNKARSLYCLPTGGPLSPILSFWTNKSMFEQLHKYATSHNLTMTVYIDDVAFSGSRISKCMQAKIRSIISAHHYEAHKFKYYGPRKWKVITGCEINNGRTRAPNKLRAKMRIARKEYDKNHQKKDKLAATINGLVGAIKQIDPTANF